MGRRTRNGKLTSSGLGTGTPHVTVKTFTLRPSKIRAPRKTARNVDFLSVTLPVDPRKAVSNRHMVLNYGRSLKGHSGYR